MVPPPITTTLSSSALPTDLVTRPRLFARLDAALEREHRLTLISAPVGAGKTTLVSDWLRQTQRPAAWLALDEADNEPASFLAHLDAALRQSGGTSEREDLPGASAGSADSAAAPTRRRP